MNIGVVKRTTLIKALRTLGGRERHKGGETIIWFPGTTIIVGRRPFSRSMLHRVEHKLTISGISREQFSRILRGKS